MSSSPSQPILHDPLASLPGYLLRRASSAMMGTLGSGLAAIGLRPVEGAILILIDANPGCTQSDLGRLLGIKRANMVPLISALVARGYLDKSPVDGRSFALDLSKDGRQLCKQAEAIMNAHEARFDTILAGYDRAMFQDMLRLIIAAGADEPA